MMFGGPASKFRKEGPAAPFIAAGAAVLGAMGTLQQGNAQAAAMRTNAAIGRQNADLAKQTAGAQEKRARRTGERALAKQRTRALKAGVTFSGSILDVIGESARNVELDALNLRHRGALQAHQFLTQSAIQEAGATNTVRAARISAATQLLSGAAKASGSFGGGGAPTSVAAPTSSGINAGAGNAPAPMGVF